MLHDLRYAVRSFVRQPDFTIASVLTIALGIAANTTIFSVVSARTALGRVFRPDEEEPSKSHVVMLSYGFWQSRFGGDRGVVGRTITLNDLPYEVVGVLARDVQFPRR